MFNDNNPVSQFHDVGLLRGDKGLVHRCRVDRGRVHREPVPEPPAPELCPWQLGQGAPLALCRQWAEPGLPRPASYPKRGGNHFGELLFVRPLKSINRSGYGQKSQNRT